MTPLFSSISNKVIISPSQSERQRDEASVTDLGHISTHVCVCVCAECSLQLYWCCAVCESAGCECVCGDVVCARVDVHA